MKRNNGITLIALIITIIVLLILASITLTFVLGDNGIVAKAKLAKEKTNEAIQDEQNKLESLEESIQIGNRYTSETWELLTTSSDTSWTEYNVNNLSNYKFVALVVYLNSDSSLSASKQFACCSDVYPISVFKNANIVSEYYGTAGYCAYINDTTIKIFNYAATKTELYGIK